MPKLPSLALALLLLPVAAGEAAWAQSQVTNFVAEGSLEPTHEIGCADSGTLSSQYTAADLFKGMRQCLDKGDLEAAVLLSALAMAYGQYDTLRGSDSSAHQAVMVLRQTYLDSADESTRTKFLDLLRNTIGAPEKLDPICRELRRIGAPAYHPRYMIQHGMKAFMADSKGDGLVAGFEAQPAWEKLLTTYMNCPDV